MSRILGLDVGFQDYAEDGSFSINFDKMKSTAKFVIVRAGQNSWPDTKFSTSWSKAKQAGLARGSYWFYDSRYDPLKQAKLWAEQIGSDLGEMHHYADFEESYGGLYSSPAHMKQFVEEFMRLLPAAKVGIYTAHYWWRDRMERVGANTAFFSKLPLWVANYGVQAPLLPSTWQTWELWQFTDSGDGGTYGLRNGGSADLNYFNGTEEDFSTRYKVPNVEPTSEIVVTKANKPFEGVEKYELIAFGAKVWVYVIDTKICKVRVSGRSDDFQTVAQTVNKNLASIGTNGGGWVYGNI